MERERVSASTSANISIEEGKCLSFLIQWAFDHQYSVAVWRLPFAPTHHVVLSRQEALLNTDEPFEELPFGFVFAPFDSSRQRLFLKADLTFTFSNGVLATADEPGAAGSGAASLQWLAGQSVGSAPALPSFHRAAGSPPAANRQAYTQLVEQSLTEIARGTFEKVVPSRTESIPLSPAFDIVAAFFALCDQNPNALASFVSSPATGSWLGATPEILVSVEDRRMFKTVALAGTQPYRGQHLKDVAWTHKDIEEQALVERYIISCFKRIRLREYDEHGPRTVIAGNLLHLKSEFAVDMVETNFPQLGSVMLGLLHPTAAVCGTPLEAARYFLAAHEGYDRQYYAGYLGPVNYAGSTQLFVNLRCAQLVNDQAVLYAGAGVTIDSVPVDELAETDIKLQTLRAVLTSSDRTAQPS